MKEHLLTVFLALTTGLTLLIFSMINTRVVVPVFDTRDILFKHQTIHGQFVITSNVYDELTLSFLERTISGLIDKDNAYGTVVDDVTILSLPQSSDVPFTTHAVVSANGDLHEIIVMESGFQIAHHAHGKKTTCEHLAVFMVSSVDLTGQDVLILGFDQQHQLLFEIQIP